MAVKSSAKLSASPDSNGMASTETCSKRSGSTDLGPSPDSGYESMAVRRPWKIKKRTKESTRETVTVTLTPEILRLLSPDIERVGLHSRFLDLWWSDYPIEYTCNIDVVELKKYGRTISLAMDLLVLLTTGVLTGKQDFIEEANKTYSLVVSSLRADLDDISRAREPFYFMTVIHMLQCCEMFDCIATRRNDWRKHMAGLKTLMGVLPVKQRRRSAEQAGWVLSRAVRVPFGLWNGLMNFDASSPEQSLSTEAVEELAMDSDSLHIYGRIPEILQQADFVRLQGLNAKPDVIADALEKLVAAESVLHRAFTHIYLQESISVLRTAPIEHFGASVFMALVDKSTFPHVYSFSDPLTALQHVYYWMCLLAIRMMHLDIRAAVGKRFPFEYDFCGLGIDKQARDATEFADNLSMSFAYMSLPTKGCIGLMCCAAPIEMAAKWYARQGDSVKLRWCQDAGAALEAKGFTKLQTG